MTEEWKIDERDTRAQKGAKRPSMGACASSSAAASERICANVSTPTRDRSVALLDEVQCRELEAFLVDRIYEFNSEVTGFFDGRLLGGSVKNEAGEVIAGFSGHTWGGCCEISNLWVNEHHRGQGLGTTMLRTAEAEAFRRGCAQVVLITHSFQAPEFYERLGYERKYVIEGRPKGHSDMVFIKALQDENGT